MYQISNELGWDAGVPVVKQRAHPHESSKARGAVGQPEHQAVIVHDIDQIGHLDALAAHLGMPVHPGNELLNRPQGQRGNLSMY